MGPAWTWPSVNPPTQAPKVPRLFDATSLGSRPPTPLELPRPYTSLPATFSGLPSAPQGLRPRRLCPAAPPRALRPPRPPARLPAALRPAHRSQPSRAGPGPAQARAALPADATPPTPQDTCLWLRDPRLGSCAPLPAPSRGRRASGTRLRRLTPPSRTHWLPAPRPQRSLVHGHIRLRRRNRPLPASIRGAFLKGQRLPCDRDGGGGGGGGGVGFGPSVCGSALRSLTRFTAAAVASSYPFAKWG